MDTKKRSIGKSISWRLIATTNGVLVAYAVTGNFASGFKIGIIGNITGMIMYYIHERVWNHIKWERR